MQIPQFERKHDAEKSDDEESKGNHVDHVQCTYCRLPQYDESTDDGEDTEGHIPAPVAGAVTFEVDGIAGRGKAPEHEPEGDDERNHFHADHRIGNQVNPKIRSIIPPTRYQPQLGTPLRLLRENIISRIPLISIDMLKTMLSAT